MAEHHVGDRRARAGVGQAIDQRYTATGLGEAMARSYPNQAVRAVVGGATRLGDLLLAQKVTMGARKSNQ